MVKRKRELEAARRVGATKNENAKDINVRQEIDNKDSQKNGIDRSATTNSVSKIIRTEHHADVRTTLPTIQIVTGSYERVLHGITASLQQGSKDISVKFADSFLFNAHASAIRCLSLSPTPQEPGQGVYLATGGSDERVNVYSLSASPIPESDQNGRKFPAMPTLGSNQISENPGNRELGTLVQHSSNITALHFPTRSKLLSASEDNTISVSRVRDLSVISTVRAPRPKAVGQPSGDTAPAGTAPAGVNDFAVHPSMKLMVSVGRGERCMRLWNLVTGKKAGVLNFDRNVLTAAKEGKHSHGEGRRIRWNTTGAEFAVAFERATVVFGEDSKVKCIALPQPPTKVHQISYVKLDDEAERLAVSTEDGRIVFYDTAQQSLTKEEGGEFPRARATAQISGKAAGFPGRIKDFAILVSDLPHKDIFVVAGSSDGTVMIWQVTMSSLQNVKSTSKTTGTLIGSYETGSRITCLAAFIMLPPIDMEGNLSEFETSSGGDEDIQTSSDEDD